MNLTLRQINNSKSILTKILNMQMDIKLAYRLRKAANQIDSELKLIESTRIDLVKKYGEEQEKKGVYSVPAKNMDLFLKEFDSLLDLEVKTKIDKIPFDCIESSGIQISPVEMATIDWIINEPIKEVKKK